VDGELVDDPVHAGLHVQEPAVRRGRGVNGSRVGGGLAQQRQLPGGAGTFMRAGCWRLKIVRFTY
jgi:hypothetical protein